MTRRSEYSLCYGQGRKFFSKSFVLFLLDHKNADLPWRFGMAVTKKVGTAVKRNRLRRLIREYFRVCQKEIPAGYDFVIVPKKEVNSAFMNLSLVTRELMPLIQKRSVR